MEKICFLIGHREASSHILPELEEAILTHIQVYGVTEFVVGHYGGFDRLAATALEKAKRDHPNVQLTLLLPYHPSERKTELPRGFQNSLYPEGMENVPRRFAIVKANQYMIKSADYLIAYLRHPASNTATLVAQAQRREKAGKMKVTLL